MRALLRSALLVPPVTISAFHGWPVWLTVYLATLLLLALLREYLRLSAEDKS